MGALEEWSDPMIFYIVSILTATYRGGYMAASKTSHRAGAQKAAHGRRVASLFETPKRVYPCIVKGGTP
jgi:hypothetical protein